MTRLEQAISWLGGKAPVLWQASDPIDFSDLVALSEYPTASVAKMFECCDGVLRLVRGILCTGCLGEFSLEISKTKVMDMVAEIHRAKEQTPARKRGWRREGLMICKTCAEQKERAAIQESNERNNDWNERRSEAAIAFIENYLDPNKSWVTPCAGWFAAIESAASRCEWSIVAEHAAAMDYQEFLSTPYWKAIAQNIKYRAKYHCQLCNASEVQLHVHHKHYGNRGSEHLHRGDLICLCADCHSTFHGK